MASAMGAGLGADMLQEVLKRKLVEQAQLAQQAQFQQNLVEQARQANQRNALGNRQIDQNASEFTANAPIREATVGHMGAETASLNRAPVEAEKERTYKSGESQKGRDFTAGQETQREAFTGGQGDLNRSNAVRIAGINGQNALNVANVNNATKTDIAGKAPVGKLTATQQSEIGNYDAVLREGQRILDTLKQTGLDKENNPISPRSRAFVAQKMKVNTNDPRVDQMIQNIGYLQTVALRGAAGNQRLTKELMDTFKPHIGDTESSGARLAVVIPELMRQLGERRHNAYRIANVQEPGSGDAKTPDPLDIR